jgi:cytochrome P450
MTADGRGPLPPGRLGLPFLGETLALQRDPFRFLEERQRRHGNVFTSRVLGRRVAFLAGAEGARAFYSDSISRADAHPYPLVDMFGGRNMEMFDGPRHAALKSICLTAFDDEALARYLPDLQRLIEDRLARWADSGELSATARLRNLAIEAICLNVLGLEPGPATDAICRDYGVVLTGIVSVPVAVPGTPYRRARAARDRLLATIRRAVAERRSHPTNDGLSRILAARAPDGSACSDDEAVLEVHHLVIAGFIVYALMAEVVRRLPELPAVAEACVAEAGPPPLPGQLTLATLRRLPASTRVVLEAKRHVPLVPLAFGRATRPLHCAGFEIPAGWRVYLALSLCNHDPEVYDQPARFDPDRFGPERAEHLAHPLAFIPQGAGPATGHRCLGLEYSTVLALSFLTLLVRRYTWELPPQDLAYRWDTVPPEPRDGLRTRLKARSAGG